MVPEKSIIFNPCQSKYLLFCAYNHFMPTLSDKLKSLGVKVGTSAIPSENLPARDKRVTPLEEILGGHFVNTRRGETFVYEQKFSLDYQHGISPVSYTHLTLPTKRIV